MRTRMPAVLGGSPAFNAPIFMTRPRVPDVAAFWRLLQPAFESRWLTNDSALVRQLEDTLRHHLGVGFCLAFCNGTIALQAALRAFDLDGEVITTPFTFPATVHAIEWVGLTPVFCDIDPHTYNLDPAVAADLVSPRTSAILPVHVFGNPCDVIAFDRLAADRGIRLIYDAAHAFGVSSVGRPIGCWGDVSMCSFHATKFFHTAEGGALVGADMTHATRLALLRNFGIVQEEEVRGVGTNGKLSELHAALGLALFGSLEAELTGRERLMARYVEGLGSIDGLLFQRQSPETVPNHSYCAIEIDEASLGLSRDDLHAALKAEGIVARKYFYPLCSENECYRHLPSARPDALPHARRLARRILCLPLYGELRLEDVDRIIESVMTIHAHAGAVRAALHETARV